MQRPALISRTNALALSGVLAVFFIVGSIFDFQISQSSVNESNGFGVFFAAFGEWPAAMALLAAGILLITFRNRMSKAKAIGQVIGGSALLLLGVPMASALPLLYLAIHPALVIDIGLLLSVVVTWGRF